MTAQENGSKWRLSLPDHFMYGFRIISRRRTAIVCVSVDHQRKTFNFEGQLCQTRGG